MTLLENLQKDMSSFLCAQSATAPLLKRVMLFLEDGELIQADTYCEKVLDIDPENAFAYLGKLMASRRIQSLPELMNAQYTIDNDNSFKKALRFAPEDMKLHLQELNMHIYGNCIAAYRSRAKVHLSHGEWKETAQQYHEAMKLWEDSKDTLPNAQAIYNDLANEVADFNWQLLLNSRQCADEAQLIRSSIPVDTDRWYLSAIKWADEAKQMHFASVAKQTLFHTHLKCMAAIKAKQTKLANIWVTHYQTAAQSDDPLIEIHNVLLKTQGYTRFSIDAPNALLKLISHYAAHYPQGVDDTKALLQAYYQKIFQSLLDFSGQEPQPVDTVRTFTEIDYEAEITRREMAASTQETAPLEPVSTPVTEHIYTDPDWAMSAAQGITDQMAAAVADNRSPYGQVSTYLVAAKALTIRYAGKDGIVTFPALFRFICQYYKEAIYYAQPEQAKAIKEKFNDFLIETVRLSTAGAEIISEASACMDGSNAPYQIYLSRLTNNYSVEKEILIPQQLTDDLAKWHQLIAEANPKKNCYWLKDQSTDIEAVFCRAESAVAECRNYPTALQEKLNIPYETVMQSAGDGQAEISSTWEQKMHALQDNCNQWADRLQQALQQAKQDYEIKLAIAEKQIKRKEALQLTGAIIAGVTLMLLILAFALPLIIAAGIGWSAVQSPPALANSSVLWYYGIHIGAPLIAGVLSLINALTLRTKHALRFQRLMGLFLLLEALTALFMSILAGEAIFDLGYTPVEYLHNTNYLITAGVLAVVAALRILLTFVLCKCGVRTRSNAVKGFCGAAFTTAGIAALAQALVCFAVAAMFICSVIIR